MMGSEACMFGMAGMGLISILLIVLLVLGIGALVKYLFFSRKGERESTQEQKGREANGSFVREK